MYGLEYLTELFCMCYKNLWASIGSKSSETMEHTDIVS